MTNDIIDQLGGVELLKKRIDLSLLWLDNSLAACNNQGSSAYRHALGKWAPIYPETTGYLLGTYVQGNLQSSDESLRDQRVDIIFSNVIPYLVSLQNKGGSFRDPSTGETLNVFDTSQIIKGLIDVYPIIAVSNPSYIIDAIDKAYHWIISNLNDGGIFDDYNYVSGYNPSYYSRVAWVLLSVENILQYANKKSLALLQYVLSLQNENLSFRNWGLYPQQAGLSHTIAYTLRGLWESATILSEDPIKSNVKKTIEKINQEILKTKKCPATYDQNWRGDYSYICSTGNAQLAILNLLITERTKDKSFLGPITHLLSPLLKHQKRTGKNKGAVSASIPIWGKYQRFRYTNWTQKFLADALVLLLKMR